MNHSDLAQKLNNRAVRNEISDMEAAAIAKQGLAVCFARGDSHVFIRGAINADVNVWMGGFIWFKDKQPISDQIASVTHFKELDQMPKIKAAYYKNGHIDWILQPSFEHSKFNVKNGRNVFCEGVVFHIDSLK